MSVNDATAMTALLLSFIAVVAWIVLAVWYGGETVYEREQHPKWFWQIAFGSTGALSVLTVVLWLAAIWGAVT